MELYKKNLEEWSHTLTPLSGVARGRGLQFVALKYTNRQISTWHQIFVIAFYELSIVDSQFHMSSGSPTEF